MSTVAVDMIRRTLRVNGAERQGDSFHAERGTSLEKPLELWELLFYLCFFLSVFFLSVAIFRG